MLVFILLIPATIYVFLRTFGQNEFSVPIYNANGGIEAYVSDMNNSPAHHKVLFNDLINADGNPIDTDIFINKIIILDVVKVSDEIDKRNYQLNRISDIFKDENSVHIIQFSEENSRLLANEKADTDIYKNNISFLNMDPKAISEMATVQLGLDSSTLEVKAKNHLILLDNKQRIRGYYNLNDFDDVDRLILEIKILLNQIHNV